MFIVHIVIDVDKTPWTWQEQKVTPDPIYKQIGAVIRTRRKALEKTQEGLAEELGISRAALASIETGRQNVLVHQLYRIAITLDMKRSDLLPDPLPSGETQPKRPPLPLPAGLTAEQNAQILKLIDEVPETKTIATKGKAHATKKR